MSDFKMLFFILHNYGRQIEKWLPCDKIHIYLRSYIVVSQTVVKYFRNLTYFSLPVFIVLEPVCKNTLMDRKVSGL